MTQLVRFDPRPQAWLAIPVDWPGLGLDMPAAAAAAIVTVRHGVRTDRATMAWMNKFNAHIAGLDRGTDDSRFVWLGTDAYPPVLLKVSVFEAQGDAAATLPVIAGGDGSVAGAVAVPAEDGLPDALAVVQTERRMPGQRKSFRKPELPERVEVRWALRLDPQTDVLVELVDAPADALADVLPQALDLLRTARVVDRDEAAAIDHETAAHTLERWERARLASQAEQG